MVAGLLSLLTGPLGKYIGGLLGIVALVLVATTYLKVKEFQAAQQATIEFNQKQAQLYQQEQIDLSNKLDLLQKQTTALSNQLTIMNNTLVSNQTDTIDWLNKQTDTQLDPIFNQTLEKMKK